MTDKKPYPDVTPQVSYPEVEQRILAFWNQAKIFQRSIEQRSAGNRGENEFVFYDGPPFANGLPHYGHLLTGYVKDAIPRYQTMRGKKVDRRFGWDCHGLPPEMEAEKELKVSGRQAIQEYGIAKFNDYCRTSVMRYTKEWQRYVNRQGRWVDFDREYKTMDLSYMESLLWAFKTLWEKGLIYEGFRVMPYSWACETPLSNFETRMDNATRPRQDPAVTVAFQLHPGKNGEPAQRLLVWTTTPWTLPSNLALAVGSEIEYTVLADGQGEIIVATAALERYAPQLKDARPIGTVKGATLVGRSYEPIFPYFKDHPNSFRVLSGEFVSTEDGTGAVHMAPGFGEDDQKLCEANGITIVCPVDDRGRFTAEVPEYVGQLVFDANKEIIRALKERGVLIRHDTYTHNYPHCWRTDTPIIYRALNSWYVRVSDIKDRMVALNQEIQWVPSHIRDGQFGKGLESAPDWSISRNRFWGTPIPVWKSDDPRYPRVDVYGSLDEIARDFGVRPTDLHRPTIDELVRPNPDDPTGKSMMRRVPEVLDCWFESGSMPFAQVHYPFENKEWFESHFPADFIVEYISQTRGWFYTLMVMATALFDRPPFRSCICHGILQGENGQKLSKRLRNYPDADEVFNAKGADALRWFFLSSPILRGLDSQIDREGKVFGEVIRSVLNPIWNVYYFFCLYANADGIKAEYRTSSPELLDRYMLSKTAELIDEVTAALDGYDTVSACAQVTSFLDVLNNWYVRRSRERFWKHEKDADKQAAYDTLYTVLHNVCRVIAPLLPMISEEIFKNLSGEESVHLTDWPRSDTIAREISLAKAMDRVREVCSAGLSLREAHNLRTRLPLRSVTIAGSNLEEIRDYAGLIRDELNVKEVRFERDVSAFASETIQINARQLGPKIGGKVQEVIKAAKAGQWKRCADGSVQIGDVTLAPEDFTLSLKAAEGVATQSLSGGETLVVLDTTVTPDLQEEGYARDLVRMVQQARKEAGFNVADHIALTIESAPGLEPALRKHERFIAEQTLAAQLSYATIDPASKNGGFRSEGEVGATKVTIAVSKI